MKYVLLSTILFTLVQTTASAQENSAFIEQVGAGNVLSLVQLSASQADIRQGGGSHIVQLEQSGGALAEIVQTGEGNRLLGVDALGVGQDGLAALSGDKSQLFLVQSGIGNTAYVDQAAGAYASITQTGAGNTATVIQQR